MYKFDLPKVARSRSTRPILRTEKPTDPSTTYVNSSVRITDTIKPSFYI